MPAPRPDKPVEQEGRDRRAGDSAERKRQGQGASQTEIEHRDGAERGRTGNADDAGLGQRVAHQPLQGRAADAETEADEAAEQGARQPQLDEDERRQCLLAAQDITDGLREVERDIANRQRCGEEHGDKRRQDQPRARRKSGSSLRSSVATAAASIIAWAPPSEPHRQPA